MKIQSPDKNSLALLRQATKSLRPNPDLFSGLKLSRTMAPDNIVFFKRNDVRAFRPEGVSHNYHLRFELVVVIEKAGPIRIGDESFLLHPGDAGLIFPNQFHHYMDVQEGRMEWLFITFELKNPDEIASLKNTPRRLDESDLQLLGLMVMEYASPGNNVSDVVEISHNLTRVLRSMLNSPPIPGDRRHIQSGKSTRDILLEKMNRYVRSHLKKAPTITELASALGYSASHMRAVFRNQLEISLGKYIRESRLSNAASLLLSTDKNISEVAEESGFKSLVAFSRAFKKAYGMAPKAYSKMIR